MQRTFETTWSAIENRLGVYGCVSGVWVISVHTLPSSYSRKPMWLNCREVTGSLCFRLRTWGIDNGFLNGDYDHIDSHRWKIPEVPIVVFISGIMRPTVGRTSDTLAYCAITFSRLVRSWWEFRVQWEIGLLTFRHRLDILKDTI